MIREEIRILMESEVSALENALSEIDMRRYSDAGRRLSVGANSFAIAVLAAHRTALYKAIAAEEELAKMEIASESEVATYSLSASRTHIHSTESYMGRRTEPVATLASHGNSSRGFAA